MSRKVWIFFYGSYINREVLREASLAPAHWEVATLAGFDIRIAPRANLVPAPGCLVWGTLATATHEELTRLYTEHALGRLGERYLPEAVLVLDRLGRHCPAMTYLSHDMVARPADHDYVERIARPAEELGFDPAYVRRIRSFLPPAP